MKKLFFAISLVACIATFGCVEDDDAAVAAAETAAIKTKVAAIKAKTAATERQAEAQGPR